MDAAGLLWDAEQHRLLAAMGLQVYAHVDLQPWPAPAATPAAPAFENINAAAAPAAVAVATAAPAVAGTAARRAPAAPEADVASAPRAAGHGAPARPARSRRGPGLLPDRLLLALGRAAALNPADPQDQALMARWPLDELRASPAAKRALWPQLRSLRKQRRNR